MAWAHGLRGADRGTAAGRDVDSPRGRTRSRHRRGCDVDIPWDGSRRRRGCRVDRGSYVGGQDRIDAAAATWIVRWARSSRLSPRTIRAAASTGPVFDFRAGKDASGGGLPLACGRRPSSTTVLADFCGASERGRRPVSAGPTIRPRSRRRRERPSEYPRGSRGAAASARRNIQPTAAAPPAPSKGRTKYDLSARPRRVEVGEVAPRPAQRPRHRRRVVAERLRQHHEGKRAPEHRLGGL